jgi:hypothetical protein
MRMFATPDDVTAAPSLSWVSSPDAAYPAANANDGIPGKVTKSTLMSDTLRHVTAGSGAVVGFAAFNTNATTATFGAISIPVAARDGDNHLNNPWKDLTGLGLSEPATLDLVISKTGAVPLQVGETRIVKTWREIELINLSKRLVVPGHERERTRLGNPLEWPSDVRYWVWEGECNRDSELAKLLDLYYRGFVLARPFVFIEESAVNKAFLVQFSHDTVSIALAEKNVSVIKIILEEIPMGVPPLAT